MTTTKVFSGCTMAEALDAVRRELGPSAIVVSRRDLRRGPMGIIGPRVVEVVACSEPMGDDEDRRRTVEWARAHLREGGGEELVSAADRIRLEVSELRDLVGRALEGDVGDRAGRLSPALAAIHHHLVERGIGEPLATELVGGAGPDAAIDEEAARRHVAAALASRLPTIAKASTPPSGPRILALVGPTGVGKTTTIAKLAARCSLQEGLRVALVTADTFRIAAVEQLRVYADLVGIPLEVAGTGAAMHQAIAMHADKEVVLVDTAGRSGGDHARIDEMSGILAAACPTEIHLVLSAAASTAAMLRAAQGYATTGFDRVIITKFDEAAGVGEVVAGLCQMGHPMSWFTDGQEVPAHIEPACHRRLLAGVLDVAAIA